MKTISRDYLINLATNILDAMGEPLDGDATEQLSREFLEALDEVNGNNINNIHEGSNIMRKLHEIWKDGRVWKVQAPKGIMTYNTKKEALRHVEVFSVTLSV